MDYPKKKKKKEQTICKNKCKFRCETVCVMCLREHFTWNQKKWVLFWLLHVRWPWRAWLSNKQTTMQVKHLPEKRKQLPLPSHQLVICDWLNGFKDAPHLNPWNWDYIILRDKGTLQMWLNWGSWGGSLSCITQMGHIIMGVFIMANRKSYPTMEAETSVRYLEERGRMIDQRIQVPLEVQKDKEKFLPRASIRRFLYWQLDLDAQRNLLWFPER